VLLQLRCDAPFVTTSEGGSGGWDSASIQGGRTRHVFEGERSVLIIFRYRFDLPIVSTEYNRLISNSNFCMGRKPVCHCIPSRRRQPNFQHLQLVVPLVQYIKPSLSASVTACPGMAGNPFRSKVNSAIALRWSCCVA
jgi:hypothetical protein